MKKYFSLCLGILCSLIISLGMKTEIFAEEDTLSKVKNLVDEANIQREMYTSQMKDIMTKHSDSDNIASYDIENAYRVNMLDSLFLTILNDTCDFENTVTDVVQWKIPITTNNNEQGLAVLIENNGVLDYSGVVVGEATNVWKINAEDIISAVDNSYLIKEPLSNMQIVHSYVYNTTFVYLSSESNEYLIPYSFYEKDIKINNGEVYTLSELTKKFNDCFDEKQMLDFPMNNGGAPFKQASHFPQYVISIFVTIAIISVISILAIKRKNTVKNH